MNAACSWSVDFPRPAPPNGCVAFYFCRFLPTYTIIRTSHLEQYTTQLDIFIVSHDSMMQQSSFSEEKGGLPPTVVPLAKVCATHWKVKTTTTTQNTKNWVCQADTKDDHVATILCSERKLRVDKLAWQNGNLIGDRAKVRKSVWVTAIWPASLPWLHNFSSTQKLKSAERNSHHLGSDVEQGSFAFGTESTWRPELLDGRHSIITVMRRSSRAMNQCPF